MVISIMARELAIVLFEDFENGYNGWTATGNAFVPTQRRSRGNQGRVLGSRRFLTILPER